MEKRIELEKRGRKANQVSFYFNFFSFFFCDVSWAKFLGLSGEKSNLDALLRSGNVMQIRKSVFWYPNL